MLVFKDKVQNTVTTSKKILRFTYQTIGKIDAKTGRKNTPDFQTINLNIDPSIILPYIGTSPVKVKMDDRWYHAIATISEMPYDQDGKKMVKLYIHDFDGTFNNNNATILWEDYTGERLKYV